MENSRFKFRAWDKIAEVMFKKIEYIGFRDEVVHLRSVNINSDDALMSFNGNRWQDNTGSYKDVNLAEIELMQYTGLKDKNGVEIYEFMEIDKAWEVQYSNGSYVLINISNNDIITLYKYMEQRDGQITVTKEYTKI